MQQEVIHIRSKDVRKRKVKKFQKLKWISQWIMHQMWNKFEIKYCKEVVTVILREREGESTSFLQKVVRNFCCMNFSVFSVTVLHFLSLCIFILMEKAIQFYQWQCLRSLLVQENWHMNEKRYLLDMRRKWK